MNIENAYVTDGKARALLANLRGGHPAENATRHRIAREADEGLLGAEALAALEQISLRHTPTKAPVASRPDAVNSTAQADAEAAAKAEARLARIEAAVALACRAALSTQRPAPPSPPPAPPPPLAAADLFSETYTTQVYAHRRAGVQRTREGVLR